MCCVWTARVNVHLPDDPAARAKDADLNVSALTRRAVEAALSAHATDLWLAEVSRREPIHLDHEVVLAAIDAARDEYDKQ